MTTTDTRPVTYATGTIADKHYDVTAARTDQFGELTVGGEFYGRTITGIVFYTGFAGCPARYYVTTADPSSLTGSRTTIVAAAGR